ncbi:hypothetical protein [Sulfitobacter sp.]|uniref:hypothetical protein n=1 Tax=Sulfitobacter sp. TaxID=1903071 RepID=UPI003EF4AA43
MKIHIKMMFGVGCWYEILRPIGKLQDFASAGHTGPHAVLGVMGPEDRLILGSTLFIRMLRGSRNM